MKNLIRFASLLCAFTVSSFAGITISAPANGGTTNSPLHIAASASAWSTAGIQSMQVYIDGALAYNRAGNTIDAYFNIASGSHTVTIKAWNTAKASSAKTVTVNASGAGIVLNSPVPFSTVSGSARVFATASSSAGISGMRVYADGTDVGYSSTSPLDKTLSLSSGAHLLVVKAWTNDGTMYTFPLSVNGDGTTSSPSTPDTSQVTIPGTAVKKADIDQMTGWDHCDTCAGAGGNGPQTAYSMTQGVGSPSIDGKAVMFWLGGSTPYSNALWWKQLGGVASAKHFVYDIKFFFKDFSAVQALEFDANQSVNGLKYIFGTECNVRENKGWRIWDTKNKVWLVSGKSCSPKANEWNHLTWEFERVGTQIHYIAVTLNGFRQVVNKYYYAKPSSVNELNVAFQMDGNSNQTDYSVWADKITLYYW